jgi:hypothetical protein
MKLTKTVACLAGGMFVTACGGQGNMNGSTQTGVSDLRAMIGTSGGELTGPKGSAFEGVHVVIPAGALDKDTEIEVKQTADPQSLPATAKACGPMFDIAPLGLALAQPAVVTLPFDGSIVDGSNRTSDDVKVWAMNGGKWGQEKQVDSSDGTVTINLPMLTTVAAGVNPPQPQDIVRFKLEASKKVLSCFAQFPGDASRVPEVGVEIVRGDLTDTMTLSGKNIKPGLQFDVFTVEHTSLLSDGTADPNFHGFGLAWYQSDLQASDEGNVHTRVRTILLDQIFGFDPAVMLTPTGTFHVGFWFNDPNAAADCGFNPANPTPFNGEHKAGPVAMISVPDASTGLGPLCTKADTSTTPAHCSP